MSLWGPNGVQFQRWKITPNFGCPWTSTDKISIAPCDGAPLHTLTFVPVSADSTFNVLVGNSLRPESSELYWRARVRDDHYVALEDGGGLENHRMRPLRESGRTA